MVFEVVTQNPMPSADGELQVETLNPMSQLDETTRSSDAGEVVSDCLPESLADAARTGDIQRWTSSLVSHGHLINKENERDRRKRIAQAKLDIFVMNLKPMITLPNIICSAISKGSWWSAMLAKVSISFDIVGAV